MTDHETDLEFRSMELYIRKEKKKKKFITDSYTRH